MSQQQPLTSEEIASVYMARNAGNRVSHSDMFDWVRRQTHLVREEDGGKLYATPKLWLIRFQHRLKHRHRLNAEQIQAICVITEVMLDWSPEECADAAMRIRREHQ